MDWFDRMKNGLFAGTAAVAGVLSAALGGWDGPLETLVGVMALDVVTGLLVAGVFKKSPKTPGGALSSGAGFRGLLRKAAILLAVFLAVLLDRQAGTALARPAVCCFFAANEGLSVLENLGRMGVPFPAFLKNALEALRARGDEGGASRD